MITAAIVGVILLIIFGAFVCVSRYLGNRVTRKWGTFPTEYRSYRGGDFVAMGVKV